MLTGSRGGKGSSDDREKNAAVRLPPSFGEERRQGGRRLHVPDLLHLLGRGTSQRPQERGDAGPLHDGGGGYQGARGAEARASPARQRGPGHGAGTATLLDDVQ